MHLVSRSEDCWRIARTVHALHAAQDAAATGDGAGNHRALLSVSMGDVEHYAKPDVP
jgi:hypothetical protein